MATEKRLISLDEALEATHKEVFWTESEQAAVRSFLVKQPKVDAVELAVMKEVAEYVVYQFGCYCQNGGRLHITHGGLHTLEWAFNILGWENPHPVPECECQIEGCHEHATCGVPTADGYKRMCGKHFAKIDGDGNG